MAVDSIEGIKEITPSNFSTPVTDIFAQVEKKTGIKPPVLIPPKAPLPIPMEAKIRLLREKLRNEIKQRVMEGRFDYTTATNLEKAIYEEMQYDENADFDKTSKVLEKSKEDFPSKQIEYRESAIKKTAFDFTLLKKRVPFYFNTQVWESEFDKVNLKVGRYDLTFKGDTAKKILSVSKNLPLYGKAEGKEFVIRRVRQGASIPTLTGTTDTVIVSIELYQNIIPLLIVTGAVGASLLGGTAFVLHKVEKIASAPLFWIIVIGLFLLIFTGKLKV